MKYFGIIANNFSKACWSWGCASAIGSNSRTIWIADAHRGDGKRYVVRADEKLTALIELESAICTNHPSSFALALPQTYTYRSPGPVCSLYHMREILQIGGVKYRSTKPPPQ